MFAWLNKEGRDIGLEPRFLQKKRWWVSIVRHDQADWDGRLLTLLGCIRSWPWPLLGSAVLPW